MVRKSSVMASALFSTAHLRGPVPAPSKGGSGPRRWVHVSGCWTQVLRKEQTEHLGPQALWPTQGNQIMGRSFTKYDFKNAPWNLHKNVSTGTSLVAQWLRIRLPMQGTQVHALIQEYPTCRGATRPVSHNYWACASGACAPQQERPRQWEAHTPRWRVVPARRN